MADRSMWSTKEVQLLLQLIRENDIVQALDGKRYRNSEIYKTLVPIFESHSFPRTQDQIRTKWKALQLAYRKAKATNNKSGSGASKCPFYTEIDEIRGSRPNAILMREGGVESGNFENIEEGEYFVPVVTLGPSDSDRSSECTEASTSLSLQDTSSSSRDGTTPPPPNSRKRRRSTYMATLEKISEQFADAQTSFKKMCDSHAEKMAEECEKQRKWEEQQAKIARKAQEKLMNRLFPPTFGLSVASRSNASYFQASMSSDDSE